MLSTDDQDKEAKNWTERIKDWVKISKNAAFFPHGIDFSTTPEDQNTNFDTSSSFAVLF